MTSESTPKVTVDVASLDDLDDVAPLFDCYRDFYKKERQIEAATAFLRDRLIAQDSYVLLARVNGAPAGFAQLYPSFSSVRLARSIILNDLYVAPEFRRHGIGRALCEKTIEVAGSVNAAKVELITQIVNTPAQSLYEELGFVKDTEFWSYNLFF
jgi:GNAT superfamily N-acetyltransferase